MNKILIEQAKLFIEDEHDEIAILANLSALFNESLVDINWVGFYLFKEDHLILGPFQGKPACIHLYPGKGVCSHAIETETGLVVDDVHQFPGHIACDSASNSELVAPLFVNGQPYGVIDIDSPSLSRFDQDDLDTFTEIGKLLENHLESIK